MVNIKIERLRLYRYTSCGQHKKFETRAIGIEFKQMEPNIEEIWIKRIKYYKSTQIIYSSDSRKETLTSWARKSSYVMTAAKNNKRKYEQRNAFMRK